MLSYTSDRRRLQLNCLNDGDKLAEQFEGMSLSYPMCSMLLGIPAIAMISCGYFGLYTWMRQFSLVCAVILIISTGVFSASGTAHHVFCCAIEWFYMQGYENAFLWVLEENTWARHFSEQFGFSPTDDFLDDNIGEGKRITGSTICLQKALIPICIAESNMKCRALVIIDIQNGITKN